LNDRESIDERVLFGRNSILFFLELEALHDIEGLIRDQYFFNQVCEQWIIKSSRSGAVGALA
jgi:hypothetical protein